MISKFGWMAVFTVVISGLGLSLAVRSATAKEKYPGPRYHVLTELGRDVEIRQYERSLIAQVEVQGDQNTALNEGFRILAGYIFGKNTARQSTTLTSTMVAQPEKIAMTSPVTAYAAADKTTVSFFMPAEYSQETLPQPQDKRIRFVQLPERKLAALRFSGSWNAQSFAKHSEDLIKRLRLNKIEYSGKPDYAYYNPPFTPPFMRRNEILISLSD